MNFILIASFLILGQVIYSAELGYPQFEIKEGNCSKTIARDLVHEKRIRLPKMPFLIREANVSETVNLVVSYYMLETISVCLILILKHYHSLFYIL